jgi:TP901 family phage tail tape measure protein
MAGAFNLTAQLNLRGPGNIKPIVAQIRKEIGTIKTNVNLNLNKNSAKAVGDVTNRLRAMNNVLATSRNHVTDLNRSFRELSTSLAAVRSGSSDIANGMGKISKSSATSAQQIKEAANAMEAFGKQSFLAVKRFAAFSVVSSAVYGLVNAVQSGFKAFIDLDRQLVRLQQVTGSGALGIKSLSDEITNLATTLGVSSSALSEVAVTLAQAGLTARQTKEALSAIAKTDLAPTFDNITDTTEGAIAAMRQFNISAADLEKTLGSINAVAAGFAVESSDIIAAIQRAGGVFAAASNGVSQGSDALNEFIAVFTSVRQTTRESAETIATGLRTIFTRIQRQSTIDALKDLGIELRDVNGQFVGGFEAIKRLSQGLSSLDPRSAEFARISEELGGFRQIGKVIPLIQQFAVAQEALKVAQQGQGSLTDAQIKAQQSFANQLARVREEFLALIKTVGESQTFRTFFTLITQITSGLIKLAGVFKPILPALAILGTLKLGKAAVSFGAGFASSFKKGGGTQAAGTALGESATGTTQRKSAEVDAVVSEAMKSNTVALTGLTESIGILITSVKKLTEEIATNPFGGPTTKSGGGKIMAFARGGVVPGSGNRDTVPAMLQPGEFVIRKKAVETIGASNLYGMNKYAKGGKAYYGASSRKVPFESGVGPSPFASTSTRPDYFSLESGSGFSPRAFDQFAFYARTNDFTLEEFAKYLEDKKKDGKKYNIGGIIRKYQQGTTDRGVKPLTQDEQKQIVARALGIPYKAGSNDTLRGKTLIGETGTQMPFSPSDLLRKNADVPALAGKLGLPVEDLETARTRLLKRRANIEKAKAAETSQRREEILGAIEQDKILDFGLVGLRYGDSKKDTSSASTFDARKPRGFEGDDLQNIRKTSGAQFIRINAATIGEKLSVDKASSLQTLLLDAFQQAVIDVATQMASEIKTGLNVDPSKVEEAVNNADFYNVIGAGLEASLGLLGAPIIPKTEDTKSIDFPQGLGPASQIFGEQFTNMPTDVTRTIGGEGKTIAKYKEQIERWLETPDGQNYINAKRFAAGGSVGSDTVPALLTPGEFVINKKAASTIGYGRLNRLNKADKIQGYNKGGYVGIQKFARGSTVLPDGPLLPERDGLPARDPATARAKAEEILADAATRAGKSLQELERETKKEIATLAQSKRAERAATRAALKTETIKTSGRGFVDADDRAKFEARTRARITGLGAGQFSEDETERAARAVADMTAAGQSFTDILNSTDPVLRSFRETMNSSNDSTIALNEAQLEMADSLGALTEAARLSAEELAEIEYVESGRASSTLGIAGRLNPNAARALEGSSTLASAQSILGGGAIGNKIVGALDALPENIGRPLKNAVNAIGGPSGAIAAGISLLGQQLPDLLKSVGLGGSVLGAGIGGALAEGGSRAVSMATLGTQLAGPLGGAIGLITGSLSGAIDGFMKAARAKQLENSMASLDKATTTASTALEKLSKFDTAANFQEAAKATDVLRDSIVDLESQAATGGTSVLGGAISGAGYGAIAGAFVGSFLPVLGTALGAAIGGTIGAVVGGITSYFSSDEISEEAFRGQLKAIDSYISGIQQLAERRINLQSLETLSQGLRELEAATKQGKQGEVAGRGFIVQEAQRAALLREGIGIKEEEDVNRFLRGSGRSRGTSGQTATDIANVSKETLAVSYAMKELNRVYEGNQEVIKREAEDRKKLQARGLELIAIEEGRLQREAQLALAMKDAEKQTESLIEQFRKMDAIIQKFGDNLDTTKAIIDSTVSAAAGRATSTIDLRAEQRILANPIGSTDAEFKAVLDKISKLSGGGQNAQQLTQTLAAQRNIQKELPELLRGANKENVIDVVDKLENVLRAGGIQGEALDLAVNQVRENLEKQVYGRQGKGLQELLEEFPQLVTAMKGLEAANTTSRGILGANSQALAEYGSLLDLLNESTRRQIDLQFKADQIRLEYASKLEEMTGRLSTMRLDEPVRNRVTALTRESGLGATLDPEIIEKSLRSALRKRQTIEEGMRVPGEDTDENRRALAEQTNIVNNLSTALEELANNTETTAQIMKEFERIRSVTRSFNSLSERLLTAGPQELTDIGIEQDLLRQFLENPASLEQQLKGPLGAQISQQLYRGLETATFNLSEPQQQSARDALTAQLMQSRGGVNIAEQTIPIIDENGKVVRKTFEELKAIEKKKADELKVAEQARIKAIEAQIGIEEQLQQALVENKIPEALDRLTDQLKAGLTINPPNANAQSQTNPVALSATEAAARAAEAGATGNRNLTADEEFNILRERLINVSEAIRNLPNPGEFNITEKGKEVAKEYYDIMKKYQEKFGTPQSVQDYLNEKPETGRILRDPNPETNRFFLPRYLQDAAIRAADTATNERTTTSVAPVTPTTPATTALSQKDAAIAEMERSLAATRAAMGMNPPVSTTPTASPAQIPTAVQDVATSLLAGISVSNPLPVKVINVAEFRDTTVGSETNGEKYNMFTTVEAKAFLSDFTNSISSFKTYVDNLQRIISVPIKIDINARHTVDVRVTGAAAFEAFKGDFTNLILNEIDKKFQQIWARSGGQLGSSGASARAVQPQQF